MGTKNHIENTNTLEEKRDSHPEKAHVKRKIVYWGGKGGKT